MRFEGVADDVGAVQLHTGLMRRAAKFGAVVGMVERRRHARHDGSAGIGIGIGEGGRQGTHAWNLSTAQGCRPVGKARIAWACIG
ncbi:hypothetical protein D3C71_2006680 [compost metagenome]